MSTTAEAVSAGGRRRTRGTYTLAELPDGATAISFQFAWLRAPLLERLAAPVTRAVMKRVNRRALQRLAGLVTRELA